MHCKCYILEKNGRRVSCFCALFCYCFWKAPFLTHSFITPTLGCLWPRGLREHRWMLHVPYCGTFRNDASIIALVKAKLMHSRLALLWTRETQYLLKSHPFLLLYLEIWFEVKFWMNYNFCLFLLNLFSELLNTDSFFLSFSA